MTEAEIRIARLRERLLTITDPAERTLALNHLTRKMTIAEENRSKAARVRGAANYARNPGS